MTLLMCSLSSPSMPALLSFSPIRRKLGRLLDSFVDCRVDLVADSMVDLFPDYIKQESQLLVCTLYIYILIIYIYIYYIYIPVYIYIYIFYRTWIHFRIFYYPVIFYISQIDKIRKHKITNFLLIQLFNLHRQFN